METFTSLGPRPIAATVEQLIDRLHSLKRIRQIDAQLRSNDSEFLSLMHQRSEWYRQSVDAFGDRTLAELDQLLASNHSECLALLAERRELVLHVGLDAYGCLVIGAGAALSLTGKRAGVSS